MGHRSDDRAQRRRTDDLSGVSVGGIEELTAVLRRFADAGYTADFFSRDGLLVCAECDDVIEPARVVIDDIARLEGDSDPDEEVVVYAISEGPCGRRGTFTVTYGPQTPSSDVAVEQALRDARRR